MRNRTRILLVLPCTLLAGCKSVSTKVEHNQLVLRTDSTSVAVQLRGDGYFGTIGFVFINNSGGVVSQAGCGGPNPPIIEKRENGEWTAAYYPIVLLCLSVPDFTWDPGITYRERVDFAAFKPGKNKAPELRVDSINGVYRLHWAFAKGRDATSKNAKRYDVSSNEFQIVLRSTAPPASNTR